MSRLAHDNKGGAPCTPSIPMRIQSQLAHDYVSVTGMMIQHNQEIAQLSPDPFPVLRVGSGDETRLT